ncbi:MAG: peptidoglycan-binding protein [Comamonadaceae bacterium]|nr:peptidoglycan-binding protein [Comamonadaceae bacterium]
MSSTEKGQDGPSAAALNVLLAQAGYATDPDATFGAVTLESLTAFQSANGLEATGAANAKTWSRLFMLLETATTPALSGTTTVGKTLAAAPGTWGPGKVDIAYQWYRGSTKISGATKTSYKLTTKDVGKTVKVKVTSKTTAFASASKTSKATAKVAKAPSKPKPKPKK